MNKNINNSLIKGLVEKDELSSINLQNIKLVHMSDYILIEEKISDIYEIEISANALSTEILEFNDINLNILNLLVSFKFIGIKSNNEGFFSKFEKNIMCDFKSYSLISSLKIYILKSTFKLNNHKLDFSLVLAIDFFNNDNKSINSIKSNPFKNLNTTVSNNIEFIFDKEFI